MFSISLNLSSGEWMQIQQHAAQQWPKEMLSRSEILRRYILVGLGTLKQATPAEISRLAHQLQASVDSGDEHLRT